MKTWHREVVGFAGVVCACIAQAQNSPLPQGNGLAARYPGDIGIAADPAVVFFDDFEGYSSPSGLTSNWSTASQGANVRIATEAGNFFAGSKALEFVIPQTNVEMGPYVSELLNPERDILFLRTYAKYGGTFNVLGSSHTGITIQSRYCCPGVPSNGLNKFYVGYEATRFASSLPSPGELTVYMYHPEQRDAYGDHFYPTGVVSPGTNTPFDFGPDFVPRPNVTPQLGRWYAYELMVKANTPGLRDGRIALWLDGNLVADFTNLRLRDTNALRLDKFTLELYINNNSLAVAQKWYDNVVAATSYIGPMVTAGPAVPRPPTSLTILP